MRSLILPCALAGTALLTAACGSYANTVSSDVQMPQSNGPNPQNLPDPNTVPKPSTPYGYAVSLSPVTIEEVMVDPVGPNTGNQYVELYNSSSFDSDVGGWVVTNGVDTFTFPYGFRVKAGERVVMYVGAAGTATANAQFAPSFSDLPIGTGSLALLRSGTDLVDFVQWGTSPNSMEGSAVLVHEWKAGDFVPVANEGRTYNYDGTASDSTAWHAGSPTPGN
ncbi:MAG: lamin tail domain-containing protein [Planctomycetes bacterium]|nr:lamin tail domain-containing protein [Planctomycetota bacterium]